jgi:hypothetical protein
MNENRPDVIAIWRDSFVRRWHTNPDMSHTTDFNCSHQGRVALLVLSLFPDAGIDLLRAAITHDQGEAGVGDVAFPVKQKNPNLTEQLDDMEADHIAMRGLPPIRLSAVDQRKLKLCDRLDAVLWMLKCNPTIAKKGGWQSDIAFCYSEAAALGVEIPIDKAVT